MGRSKGGMAVLLMVTVFMLTLAITSAYTTAEAEEGAHSAPVSAELSDNRYPAYSIAPGLEAVSLGWEKITSLDEVGTYGAEGLYIGNVNGYYLKNQMGTNGKGNTRGYSQDRAVCLSGCVHGQCILFRKGGGCGRLLSMLPG